MFSRNLPRLLTFLLLLMTAASATYWVLLFTSHREVTEPVVQVALGNSTPRSLAADTSAIAGLFGAKTGTDVGNLKVLGIISEGRAGTGIAVIAYQGNPTKTVKAGEEIAPGMVLAEVESDGITLMQGGVRRRVLFPVASPAGQVVLPPR